MFTNMVQYQYVWHKAENFLVEDALSLIDQSLQKSMKSKKKLSTTGRLTVMMSARN